MTNRVGFFFDFDGTIVDNVSIMKDAYFSFMESLNLKGSGEEFDKYNGIPLKHFIVDLNQREKLNLKIEDLLNVYFDVLDGFYRNIEPRDGFLDILQIMRSKEIPFCIVTSSTKKLLKSWMSKNLMESDEIPTITSDDVINGKPNPEPYKKAKEILGCESGFAIEDSVNGLKSAIGAGLHGIYFHNTDQDPSGLELFRTINNFTELRDLVE